ncbi:hypothetical protein [uncultured Acinetobacter sp.]|uniref:hypothetical protein n=1 Tax=uncultured Acinetobacter sp. TaxID=165433 RepID=UPI00260ABDA5|nr:hypothetical protein [uncultured Acinetobacter sp.]
MLKFLILNSLILMALPACQLISPIVTDYNGVRMDVAHYINHSWRFSLKERDTLVAYAKQQQKITAWQRLNPTEQHNLAQQRLMGRYCATQKMSPKKLDLVDAQIFADVGAQRNLAAMHQLQHNLQLNLDTIDCDNKI